MTHITPDEAARWRQRYEHEQQAREQVERRSGQLLAQLGHELRTPLHGVLGMVELLSVSPLEREQRDQLEVLREAAVVLRGLVGELVDHASLEQGLVRVSARPTDVAGLLRNADELLRASAGPRSAQLSLAGLDTLPPRLHVDGGLLGKIIDQLISYALAAAPGGYAELKARLVGHAADGVRLRLVLSHTGERPMNGSRDAALEPCVEPDQALPSVFGSLGLGLPIARRLAGLLGGSLEPIADDGTGSVLALEVPVSTVQDDGVGGTG